MEHLKGKEILVAGGAGLVGTNLTRRLVEQGLSVTGSYLSRKPPEDLKVHYDRYDFTNYEECLKATRGKDCVFICAVQASGVAGMLKSPTSAILPNLEIHAGLLEACLQNNVEKVVWVSSSTVYQEAFYPIREDLLDLNKPPYALYQGGGWVYRYLEELAKYYHQRCGLRTGIIRTASIYGPYDRFDDRRSHVVPALIKRAIRREDPFIVWGSGDTIRDFVYVDDLIDGILKVMEGYCNGDPVNISSGIPVSIKELVETILDVCDHKVAPVYDSTKPTAVPYRVIDNTKYETVLGRSMRTSLRDGIMKTVRWYQSEQSRD